MVAFTRTYGPAEVQALRGTVRVEHSLARAGAEKLWRQLRSEPYIAALGALTGNQAVEMAQAGLKAIYMSGWQVAADANLSGQMYPDQSLYPVKQRSNSGLETFNNALLRADQISHMSRVETCNRLDAAHRCRRRSWIRRDI